MTNYIIKSNDDNESNETLQQVGMTPSFRVHLEKPSKPVNIVTHDVASVLYRTKFSDRNVTYISAAVAKSLEHDLSQIFVCKCLNISIRDGHVWSTL